MNKLFLEAFALSAAFDPMLQELASKKLTLEDLVASDVAPRDKVRILKGLARNCFKVFEIQPHPLMVMEGLAPSQEQRTEMLEEAMEVLRPLFEAAYLEANSVPAPTPLGYYAVRMGDQWTEIHTLSAAMNPEIQAMRTAVQVTNYFG